MSLDLPDTDYFFLRSLQASLPKEIIFNLIILQGNISLRLLMLVLTLYHIGESLSTKESGKQKNLLIMCIFDLKTKEKFEKV